MPSTSIAGRKSLGGFSVPRPVCINTGIACYNMFDPKDSVPK